MEESFETIFAADGCHYRAHVAYEETESDSCFKVVYKSEKTDKQPGEIEIVFNATGNKPEDMCWQIKKGNPNAVKNISKEFLSAVGKRIEDHYQPLA